MSILSTVTPWTFSGKFSCGASASASYNRLDYQEIDKSVVSKRTRPAGVELLFSPTPLYRRSRSIFDAGWFRNVQHPDPWHAGCWGTGKVSYAAPLYTYWGTSIIPSWPSGYLLISNTELLLKIKDEKVNLAMCAVEYKETGRLFYDAAHKLLDIYRGIRQGKRAALKLLKSGIRSSPNTWMLYRYGITPLVSDVSAISDLLGTLQDRALVRRIALKRHLRTFQRVKYTIPDSAVLDPSGWKTVEQDLHTRRVAYVQYRNDIDANMLGLSNPAQLAWEVIPYSFVVDWFIGIGDYLSSLDALNATTRVSSTTTKVGFSREVWPSGYTEGLARSYDRATDSPLTPDPPRWEPSLNWKRLTDSTVMLRNIAR
jgi:hypothetical protein